MKTLQTLCIGILLFTIAGAQNACANLMKADEDATATVQTAMTDMECSAYFLPEGATHEITSAGLSIIYDGFRRSAIETCACVTNPLGGFDHQAKLLQMLDETGRTRSYVDAGGFLRDAPAGSDPSICAIPDEYLTKTLAMMKMYKMANIEAVNVGFMDMGAGIGFLKQLQKDYDTPFISANIVDAKTHERLFPAYKIVEKKPGSGRTVKVAYLGITRNNVAGVPESILKNHPYRILDEVSTMKESIPELRKKADMVVVLLYARRSADYAKKYLGQLKGQEKPDLVICSEFYGMVRELEMIDQTVVISTGYEGRNVGNLVVTFDDQLHPKKCYNKLIDLRPSLPKVPEYTNVINEVLSKIKPKASAIKKINLD